MDLRNLLSKITEIEQQPQLKEGVESSLRLGPTDAKYRAEKFSKGKVHKGKYGAEYDSDDEGDEQKKKAEPTAPRGRGRPKKGADITGNVKQYSSAGLQDIGWLPKAPKKIPQGKKHTLKDWFERLDDALMNETLAPGQKPIPVVGKQGDTQSTGAGFLNITDTSPAGQALQKTLSDLSAQNKAQIVVPTQGQPTQAQPAPAGATGQAPAGQTQVKEKWGTETKVSPSEKGKYAGKSKAELLKSYNALKKSGPHKKGSTEFGKMRELAFAIRAKGDWGKVKEEGNSFTRARDRDEQWALQQGKKQGEGNSFTRARDRDEQWALQQGKKQGVSEGKLNEGGMDEAHLILQQLANGDMDIYDVLAHPNGPAENVVSEYLQKMYDDISIDNHLHPDDDFEDIIDIIGDRLAKEYGTDDLSEGDIPPIAGKDTMGAGLGAGRNPVTLEGKKAAITKKKKAVKEGISEKISAARLEGKAHGLRGNEYRGKHYDDMEEARAYHEGYKEGLDECYGQDPIQGFVGDEMDEGNAFGAALARTPHGGQFKLGGRSFTDTSNYDATFESWDKQLTNLINEGMTVSVSQGQEGTSDSVSINATDAEADKLLAFVKQAGLGIFGGEQDTSNVTDTGISVDGDSAHDHGDISVVDDHDGMMSLIKKLSGAKSAGEDYKEEQQTQCDSCGDEECSCGEEEQVDEVESEDQMMYQVAENNPPDSGAEDSIADDEAGSATNQAAAEEDQASAEEEAASDDADDDEEEVAESVHLDEWANDAGKNGTDEAFETDIDFMTKVISGGLNKEKQTGQTTIPVIAGQKPRMGSDGVNEGLAEWKRLAGIMTLIK